MTMERATAWMRDDCSCPTVSPDGDGCALYADYTTGLCDHCQGHDDERRNLLAVVEAARALPDWLMEHEATDALRAALDEVKP